MAFHKLQLTVSQKVVLSSICTMENERGYRLDPICEAPQNALVIITNQTDDIFVVEQVQLLTTEQATQAATSRRPLCKTYKHTVGRRHVPHQKPYEFIGILIIALKRLKIL